MQQLIICRGLPGSGKSTFAKRWVDENPKNRVRVCRDDIRRMLGPYWVPSREHIVTEIERGSVSAAIHNNYSVIIDATNLGNMSWAQNFAKVFNYEIIIKDFTDVSVESCIERDRNRPKEEQVGEKVILDIAKKYNLI